MHRQRERGCTTLVVTLVMACVLTLCAKGAHARRFEGPPCTVERLPDNTLRVSGAVNASCVVDVPDGNSQFEFCVSPLLWNETQGLWRTRTMHLHFSAKDQVVKLPNSPLLLNAVDALAELLNLYHRVTPCRNGNNGAVAATCELHGQPYAAQCVRLDITNRGQVKIKAGLEPPTRNMYMRYAVAAVTGLLLVLLARKLSSWMAFHLAAGFSFGTLLAILLVMYFVSRRFGAKGLGVVGVGGSVAAFSARSMAQAFLGAEWQEQLALVVAVMVVVFGLVGMGLVYQQRVFEDERSEQILYVVLRYLVGTACFYHSNNYVWYLNLAASLLLTLLLPSIGAVNRDRQLRQQAQAARAAAAAAAASSANAAGQGSEPSTPTQMHGGVINPMYNPEAGMFSPATPDGAPTPGILFDSQGRAYQVTPLSAASTMSASRGSGNFRMSNEERIRAGLPIQVGARRRRGIEDVSDDDMDDNDNADSD